MNAASLLEEGVFPGEGESRALPDTAAHSQGEMRWQPASSLPLWFTDFQWQENRVVRGSHTLMAYSSLKHAMHTHTHTHTHTHI